MQVLAGLASMNRDVKPFLPSAQPIRSIKEIKGFGVLVQVGVWLQGLGLRNSFKGCMYDVDHEIFSVC